MSTNIKNLDPHRKQKVLSALESAAKNINGEDAAIKFINHLLTEGEKVTIGRRILISKMLLRGNNRAEVCRELKVSPNTFTRTKRWLEGEIPDYADVVKQYEAEQENKRSRAKRGKRLPLNPFGFATIKRRHPIHFLLIDLFDQD